MAFGVEVVGGVAVLPVEVVVEVGGVVVVARAFRPLLKAAAMAVSIGMGLLLLLAWLVVGANAGAEADRAMAGARFEVVVVVLLPTGLGL